MPPWLAAIPQRLSPTNTREKMGGHAGQGHAAAAHPGGPTGNHHGHLIKDPAIERWSAMRERTLFNFKWTPRTAVLALVWGVAVPWLMYEGAVSEFKNRDKKAGREVREFPSLFSFDKAAETKH